MKEDISHNGKVVAVNPQFTTVEILSASACGSCHAASLCGMGNLQKKAIQVPTDYRNPFAVGEEVEVVLKATMGFKAVWVAYVMPLAVLLGAVLGVIRAGGGELMAALFGLGLVGVYYFMVYLFRHRLKDSYIFTVNKKSI